MRIKQMKPIDTNLILKSFNHKNLVVAKSHEVFEKINLFAQFIKFSFAYDELREIW